MNEVTLTRMKQMKLHGMHGVFKTAIETGKTDDYTIDQFVSMITDAEWDDRNNRKIERLIRNARFHYNASIENLLKYFQLKPKGVMPDYDRLLKLTLIFARAGFQNEAIEFAFRQFELINDSLKYQNWYPRIVFECGNTNKTTLYYEQAYKANETGTTVFNKLLEMY